MQKPIFLLLIPFLIFLNKPKAQSLDGIYSIYKIHKGKGAKEVFQFFNDSCFRYQRHSPGLILVGEGVYRLTPDSLLLFFGNCKACISEPLGAPTGDSIRTENWIFLKTIMPWRLPVWGILNEVMVFKISKWTKNFLTLRDNNFTATFRQLNGREEENFNNSFQQYFHD
jgi:hypothetical protein